jgi:hypothetical protein
MRFSNFKTHEKAMYITSLSLLFLALVSSLYSYFYFLIGIKAPLPFVTTELSQCILFIGLFLLDTLSYNIYKKDKVYRNLIIGTLIGLGFFFLLSCSLFVFKLTNFKISNFLHH